MKQRTAFVIPHSHFDPEWLHPYTTYLRQEFRHLRQRLDLLQEDPSHGFSPPEELATLPFLRQCSARDRRRFRDAILRRQVEPKGCIAPGELTMHTGEAIARQFVLGKVLLERELKLPRLDLPVAHSIDNYGLCPQLPQILAQCDRRCLVIGVYSTPYSETLHTATPPTARLEQWWVGPDGSTLLLILARPDYGGIGPAPTEKTARLALDAVEPRSSRRAMFFYSGGDMVPPDPHLPEKLRQFSSANGTAFKIALPREYFQAVRRDRSISRVKADAITDHLGAFESRVEARLASRRAESTLLMAERFATAASTVGAAYPHAILDHAWFQLLVNHDHDPALACLRDSLMRDVMQRHRHVQDAADHVMSQALKHIARQADTRSSLGQPIVVFNPMNWKRSDVVTIDREGDSAASVVDGDGIRCASYAYRSRSDTKVSFLARDVPSLGFKVFFVHNRPAASMGDAPPPPDPAAAVGELRVEIDHGCANVVRIRRDVTGKLKCDDVRQTPLGRLGWRITRRFRFGRSDLLQEAFFYSELDRTDVRLFVNWRHVGHRVTVGFPMSSGEASLCCHEPFMVGLRDPRSPTARKPVLYWGGWHRDDGEGVAVANRGTHSYRIEGQELRMTLFRSVDWRQVRADPMFGTPPRDKDCGWCMLGYRNDMAAELGRHEFDYSVLPFAGSVAAGRVHQRAYEFNYPLVAIRTTAHKGTLPPEFSFVGTDRDDLILSTWKRAYRAPGSVLRFYEPYGRPSRGRIMLARGRIVGRCNMDERPLHEHAPQATVELACKPYEVKSLLIEDSGE